MLISISLNLIENLIARAYAGNTSGFLEYVAWDTRLIAEVQLIECKSTETDS